MLLYKLEFPRYWCYVAWVTNTREKFVKLMRVLTASTMLTMLSTPMAMAADSSISASQKKEIQKIVHDYLVSNPEVLIEASQALQQKQQQSMQVQAQSAIIDNAKALFSDKITMAGNPNGKVTLVEFFDYQCIHCKKMAPVISELLKKDKNLRVVYKEYPIFGKSSDTASKAALAAGLQHKYMAMHEALFNQPQKLDDTLIEAAAKSIGLNMDQFKTDKDSKAVSDMLEQNRQLAEKLHLMGTPAFIIASTNGNELKKDTQPIFIPGAASEQTLQDLISKAAKS